MMRSIWTRSSTTTTNSEQRKKRMPNTIEKGFKHVLTLCQHEDATPVSFSSVRDSARSLSVSSAMRSLSAFDT